MLLNCRHLSRIDASRPLTSFLARHGVFWRMWDWFLWRLAPPLNITGAQNNYFRSLSRVVHTWPWGPVWRERVNLSFFVSATLSYSKKLAASNEKGYRNACVRGFIEGFDVNLLTMPKAMVWALNSRVLGQIFQMKPLTLPNNLFIIY